MKLIKMRDQYENFVFVNPDRILCIRGRKAQRDVKSGLWKYTSEIAFGAVGGFDGPDSSGEPGMTGLRVMGSVDQVALILTGSFTGNLKPDAEDVGWFRVDGGRAIPASRPV